MKSKIVISIILALAIAVAVLGTLLDSSNKEKKRFKDNQDSLLQDVKHYQTKDSLNVASVQKLTETNQEFKKYNSDLVKTVDDLNIKVRRLQSVSQTSTSSEYKVKIQVKDSLVFRDSKPGTIKCIQYRDKWLTLDGCFENELYSGLIESRDTIEQFVHRVPRKFLFIKYGTKAIRQEVICKNPHSKIAFTKYIELKN